MILSFSSYRTSKGKLLRLLKPMRREQFANKINPIIAEKRAISEDQAKQKQDVQSNEVIAFLEDIGEPLNDYAKQLDVGSHRMNNTRLRLLFPTLSAPEFSKVINKTSESFNHKNKSPESSKLLKFACIIATLWLSATIYLFYAGLVIAGYVVGGLLFSVAFLVSTTDFCIPSTIYNFIFKVKV